MSERNEAAERLLTDVLDLFLPLLDEPYSYRVRQDRFDERMRKSYTLESIVEAHERSAVAAPLDVDALKRATRLTCMCGHPFERHSRRIGLTCAVKTCGCESFGYMDFPLDDLAVEYARLSEGTDR